jgi:hypothetical protein
MKPDRPAYFFASIPFFFPYCAKNRSTAGVGRLFTF